MAAAAQNAKFELWTLTVIYALRGVTTSKL
jgi:hypothetical protein